MNPPSSPFELRWNLFGIRYRVAPSFWLISALLAYVLVVHGMPVDAGTMCVLVAIDVGCIFTAIVFCNFVQGLVYRSYGIRSEVHIQDFFGGIVPEDRPATSLQRIAVALANPASAFLLYAVVIATNTEFAWAKQSMYTQIAFAILRIISLAWGVIGLIPMWPYSGGQVLMEVLNWVLPRRGLEITLIISIVVAIAYIAYVALYSFGHARLIRFTEEAYLPPSIILAVFFGISTMRNVQLLQFVRQQRREFFAESDDRVPWER